MSRYSYGPTKAELRRREAEASRRLKAEQKQSALDAARAAVEDYEAQIAELKSQHTQCSEQREWLQFAASLPPPAPSAVTAAEMSSRRARAVLLPLGVPETEVVSVAIARERDASQHQVALAQYEEEVREQRDTSQLAKSVLVADAEAWVKVLREQPLLPPAAGNPRIEFRVHSRHLLECRVFARGSDAIPAHTQSLTAAGKLSSKETPRAHFMEVYQDFLCSAVLRIAREVHALLDVGSVLVTVYSTEHAGIDFQPVLSAIFERRALHALDFARIDPSDAVETFPCRTEFKASRRTGAFKSISPFQSADVPLPIAGSSLSELSRRAQVLLDELE